MNAKTLIDAMSLWEATGPQIAQAARETSGLLAQNGIPNLIAGGLAVQMHGYPRFTKDADLIVPDVQKAHEFLISRGFRQSLRKLMCVIHPLKVDIDLLPAGKCLEPQCQVMFPQPEDTGLVMHPVTLTELISLKLDSYTRRPKNRIQDAADVKHLITNNRLPRDLDIHSAMAAAYQQIWDDIQAEDARLGPPPES